MIHYSMETYINLCKGVQRAGFEIKTFSDALSDLKTGDNKQRFPTWLIRHDIDADPHAALSMALVEFEIGVRSTYLLMTRSPIYNLFSRGTHSTVKTIIEMNHEVGLHYDHGFDLMTGASTEQVVARIDRDRRLFEDEFQVAVNTVSFHQPSVTDLPFLEERIGLYNTYDPRLMSRFQYLSDSNREMDEEKLRTAFVSGMDVQMLIHPIWWVYEDSNTHEVWRYAVRRHLDHAWEQLISTERTCSNMPKFCVNFE